MRHTRLHKAPAALLKAPPALVDFQRWFGMAAARPLLPGNGTRPRGVNGPSLRAEANARLRTVGGMSGLERLEVYNRQYWFRLITIMQEEFPCTLHVIGLDGFNTWVIRFLDAHPPASPYLAQMDQAFPDFLRRRYRGSNRLRVLEAAAYDKAFSRAFDAPTEAFASASDAATSSDPAAAAQAWMLAPQVTPLWLHWDFTAYRARCLADEPLTGRFALRTRGGSTGQGLVVHQHDHILYEKPVTHAEFLLLEALRKPSMLDQVFRAARKGATPRDLKAMEQHVGGWFRDWTELGWISTGLRASR